MTYLTNQDVRLRKYSQRAVFNKQRSILHTETCMDSQDNRRAVGQRQRRAEYPRMPWNERARWSPSASRTASSTRRRQLPCPLFHTFGGNQKTQTKTAHEVVSPQVQHGLGCMLIQHTRDRGRRRCRICHSKIQKLIAERT